MAGQPDLHGLLQAGSNNRSSSNNNSNTSSSNMAEEIRDIARS
jgi:hypothetical protein